MESETQSIDRIMDWHDHIFIPDALRHTLGFDPIDQAGEYDEERHGGLLILKEVGAA